MGYMEEFDNEKYNTIESIETVFQRINRFGLEYNCCFGCFVPPATFQVAGIIKDKLTKNNLTGYLVNKYDQGICLIPLVVNDKKKICINMYGYIDIKDADIKYIKIKTEDFVMKRIKIKLKDKTKYTMVTSKKIKGVSKHEQNLKRFIEFYE